MSTSPRETVDPQPLAIIGIGCRFPGACGPAELWKLLREGCDTVGEIPPERFDPDRFCEPGGVPGKIRTRAGGFLDEIDRFEPAFFGISPREAEKMDPQQRLLLEIAWEALEDAGEVPAHLSSTTTGVFVGMCYNDYEDLQFSNLRALNIYSVTGGSRSVAAGRISHALGLQGPSVTLDAACASSLVALHLACRSLRSGESSLALAGGVNLILEPQTSIGFSRAEMLAADGRCKFCDAAADGFVRSEGVALIVLKPLEAALASGDRIYAVIRGSATNNDGATGGSMMTPGTGGQQSLLRAAYRDAGVPPEEVDYVEAHGTGTRAGDPVELESLGTVFGPGRSADRALRVGSVKTNLGHTEGAAGIAGVIKVALSLHHGALPPSLHLREPNPRIPWDELPVRVQTEREPWPRRQSPRFAGVSSFGINGSNAHVVLAESPSVKPVSVRDDRDWPVPLSARSPEALKTFVRELAHRLDGENAPAVSDLSFTAGVRRARHEERLTVVGRSVEEIREALGAHLEGEHRPGMARGRAVSDERPRVAFVFPGQGSQWLGMGQELMEAEPAFREALERCDRAIRRETDWSLLDELQADETTSRLSRVDVIQPAIFAMQVALADLWRAWGIEPDAVVGQSMGEVAAACVSGALDLEDASRVICRRSRIARSASGEGGMAVVELSLDDARSLTAGLEDRLSVAVSNGPSSTVLSGDVDALEEVLRGLEKRGVFCRRIKVDYASHSPHMDPLRPQLLEALDDLSPRPSAIPVYSTVLDRVTDGAGFGAGYWADNLREPVLFAGSLRRLLDDGHGVFLEVSPHPVVLSSIKQALHEWGREAVVLPSTRRDEERRTLLGSLGELFTTGYPVDWSRLHPEGGNLVDLPTYPWQRESYWLEGRPMGESSSWHARGAGHGTDLSDHPLLGWRLRSAAHESTHFWETLLDPESPGYLRDHRVQGSVVLPAACTLEMALAAAAEVWPGDAEIESARFEHAVFLPERGRSVQLVITPQAPEVISFRLFGRDPEGDDEWTLHASGSLRRGAGRSAAPETRTGTEPDPGSLRETSVEDLYRRFAERGLPYGPAFRGIRRVWIGEGEALAEIGLTDGAEPGRRYRCHPVLLDACFQTLATTVLDPESEETMLPVALETLTVRDGGRGRWCRAMLRPRTSEDATAVGDVELRDDHGRIVLEARGLTLRTLEEAGGTAGSPVEAWLHRIAWRKRTLPERVEDEARGDGGWIVLADEDGIATGLAARLEEAGALAWLVRPGSEDRFSEEGAKVCPERAESFRALFDLAAERFGGRFRGVVHLWSLDLPEPDGRDGEAWQAREHLGCLGAVRLIQGLAGGAHDDVSLYLVTRGTQPAGGSENVVGPVQAPLWGLGRVVPFEHGELDCRLVDLPSDGDGVAELTAEILAEDGETQVALRSDGRYVARWEPWSGDGGEEALDRDQSDPGERVPSDRACYRMELDRPGIPDDIVLRSQPPPTPGAGEVLVRVRAGGLNFIDVMKSMGVYPGQPTEKIPFGVECSGRVEAVGEGVDRFREGDEVIGVVPSHVGCFRSHALVASDCAVHRPSTLDDDAAATVPIPYLTAYYGLVEIASLRRGERILIHSATGGVGLAAIQIARHLGAEIFATAGNGDKREHLRALGIEHVMDSRSLAFAEEIASATDGEGVDVVLNSLSGEAISKGLEILRPGGRFVELGKRDIYADSRLGLLPFRNGLSFTAVDVDRMISERHPAVRSGLESVVRLLEQGAVSPLPAEVHPADAAVEAFRRMSRARHIGKIVLSFDEPEVVVQSAPASPAPAIRAEGSYLLTGGLGGLGLTVARWLVERGARNLALLGRSGPSPEARKVIEELEQAGTRVRVVRADVSDLSAVERAVREVEEHLGPLRGVLHAAGVLEDKTLLQLDGERLRGVMAPKVDGAWNLHRATRDRALDQFVLFSSAASILGSPGQANYAAANAFMDSLAHHRRILDRPALAINWGAWSEVGLAARPDRGGRLARRGLGSISPRRGVEALGRVLELDEAQVAVTPFDLGRWRQFYPAAAELPLFEAMAEATVPEEAEKGTLNKGQLLAASEGERIEILGDYLKRSIARVLGLAVASLDPTTALTKLGLDSLMALELRNRVEVDVGLKLPVVALLEGPSTQELARDLAGQLADGESAGAPSGVGDATGKSVPRTSRVSEEELERMDEGEVDALLADLMADEPADGATGS